MSHAPDSHQRLLPGRWTASYLVAGQLLTWSLDSFLPGRWTASYLVAGQIPDAVDARVDLLLRQHSELLAGDDCSS